MMDVSITNQPTDGHLLHLFRVQGDQNAFAELVKRHGRMVTATTCSILGDPAVAEDVTQAVFLTLARKGAALEDAQSIAGWLNRVSVCLARDEWRKLACRARHEREAGMYEEGETRETADESFMEALRLLYEELGTLSEKYRQPVILHHLEGMSYEAAAPLCGCNQTTFGMRLTRGREQLRERLAKRGVAMGVTALVAGLGQSASAAELPAGFVALTCAAAKGGAVSAKVTALMESALKMLFWAKVKTVVAVIALTAAVAGGGLAATQALVHRPAVSAVPAATPAVAVPAVVTPAPAQGGQVWAWGLNDKGQLGDGTTNNSPTPVAVPGLDGVTAVAVGYQHTVAIRDDGSVWAWGQNQYGQLGDGTTTDRRSPVPVKTADGTQLRGITAVAAGLGHTVALKSDGSLLTWGRTTDRIQAVPTGLPGPVQLSGITALAAGDSHTLALRGDTTVWAWGRNDRGQLGDGTKTSRPTPVQVQLPDGSPLSGIVALAAGGNGSVALRNDRTVWTWGNFGASKERFGRLVDGTETITPVQVKLAAGAPLADVTAIAAGKGYAVALRSDTTVWAWGENNWGQLGDGTETDQPTPVPVKMADGNPLSGITAIAAGWKTRTLALRNDRTVWEWGSLTQGKPRGVPVQVKMADGRPLSGVTAIAASGVHTVVLVGDREKSVGVSE